MLLVVALAEANVNGPLVSGDVELGNGTFQLG